MVAWLEDIQDCERRCFRERNVHSSGSTDMPKPKRSSHRYLLAFTACHDFDDLVEAQICNVSTLPLFMYAIFPCKFGASRPRSKVHVRGYGLVAPCLSLGIGMTLVPLASSSVPTAASIMELLNESRSQPIMTVPSIMEDVASMEELEAINTLDRLEFVAFGGGLH